MVEQEERKMDFAVVSKRQRKVADYALLSA